MSILNRENDGLFNILIVLVRCLAYHGTMDREKLLNVCTPTSAVQKRKRINGTVNTWVELGVLKHDEESNKISIEKPLSLSLIHI